MANIYAYNKSMGISEFSVSDASKLFFPEFFELSGVKLYRNDLRGNKNYFELAGGSSYRG